MNNIQRLFLLSVIMTFLAAPAWADTTYVHRIEADVVPSAVIHNNDYLRGNNPDHTSINSSTTLRLKYTLQQSKSPTDVAAYCGVGVGMLLTNKQLGSPFLAYIVQGAPIVNITKRISLNYEFNVGAAIGWKPYEAQVNETNYVLGSETMFYIGTDVFFRFILSRHWDFNLGYGYAHSSNANLEMPNEGLNTRGGRISLAYYFNRNEQTGNASVFSADPVTDGHRWVTDIVAFGGWKKTSLVNPETYGVAGISVSPTYRINSAIAAGPSLELIHDNSINPQVSVGLQARAELTMPILRASAGFGHHVVGGMNSFYETLAMKVDLSKHFFINIGYIIYNYNYTNNLMLGLGIRY